MDHSSHPTHTDKTHSLDSACAVAWTYTNEAAHTTTKRTTPSFQIYIYIYMKTCKYLKTFRYLKTFKNLKTFKYLFKYLKTRLGRDVPSQGCRSQCRAPPVPPLPPSAPAPMPPPDAPTTPITIPHPPSVSDFRPLPRDNFTTHWGNPALLHFQTVPQERRKLSRDASLLKHRRTTATYRRKSCPPPSARR